MKDWQLTGAIFEDLLKWLDEDRERAGVKYEAIRSRLITIFTFRRCYEAEDLADEVINRVAVKLPEMKDNYTGDRALYFYGIAQKVHQEYVKRKAVTGGAIPEIMTESAVENHTNKALAEEKSDCLDLCLKELPRASKELVLRYYHENKGAKVKNRKRMATRMKIPLNALRIRAYRIRAALQDCVEKCTSRRLSEIKSSENHNR